MATLQYQPVQLLRLDSSKMHYHRYYSKNDMILIVSWILKSSNQSTVYRFLETSVPLAKSYFKYNNEII